MSLTTWTTGDVSAGTTLTSDDHLYETHLNELRTAANGLESLLDPDDQTLNIANAGTSHGIYLNQTGVLATSKYGLYIYSNVAQTSGWLSYIRQDHASSTQYAFVVINDGSGVGQYIGQNGAATAFQIANASTQYGIYLDRTGVGADARPNLYVIDSAATTVGNTVQFDNAGTGHALYINQTGDLAGGKNALRVYSNVAQTDNNTTLAYFHVDNASASDFPVVYIRQDSPSHSLYIDQYGQGRSFVIANFNRASSFDIENTVTNVNFSADETAYYNGANITVTSVVNDGATYTKSGKILSIISAVTETSGTITDTATILDIQQTHAQATGAIIKITNAGTGSGVDMSAFSTNKPLLKAPVDDTSIAGTTNSTGRMAIDRGGTTVYIPYYA